jgi:hypothetical protein
VFELDAIVKSPTFNYDELTNPTVYDLQGGLFSDGYGPEELVPGLVTDELQFNVRTNPATLPPGQHLDFRIQVSKFGLGEVYNTNPFTQTTLAQDFISTGSISDILYVTDASKLVEQKNYSRVANSSGIVDVPANLKYSVSPVTIDLPNPFTVQYISGNILRITISGITVPTPVTVTVTEGNMILLNSEFIQFTQINLTTNIVTGLLRGRKGTITNGNMSAGTTVQSVLPRDKMPQRYYDRWWYDISGWDFYPWDTYPWDNSFQAITLEQSTTAPANFLKRQN